MKCERPQTEGIPEAAFICAEHTKKVIANSAKT